MCFCSSFFYTKGAYVLYKKTSQTVLSIGIEGGGAMKEAVKKKIYKSPRRKLVKFFEKSRDQWKNKCQEAKKTLKRLKNRIRFLKKSKEYWKSRVKELECELAQLKAGEQKRDAELEALKKKLMKNR